MLQFQESKSRNYPKALGLTKKFSDHELIAGLHTIRVNYEMFEREHQFLKRLWRIIKGWSKSRLLLDGEECTWMFIDYYLTPIKCYQKRQERFRPDKHCNYDDNRPGWGCQHLSEVLREPRHDYATGYYTMPEDPYWYRFGKFVNQYTWQINKDQIKAILTREAKIKMLHLCPIFNLQTALDRVDKLPDEINLLETGHWKIRNESTHGFPGDERPVGVEPIMPTEADWEDTEV